MDENKEVSSNFWREEIKIQLGKFNHLKSHIFHSPAGNFIWCFPASRLGWRSSEYLVQPLKALHRADAAATRRDLGAWLVHSTAARNENPQGLRRDIKSSDIWKQYNKLKYRSNDNYKMRYGLCAVSARCAILSGGLFQLWVGRVLLTQKSANILTCTFPLSDKYGQNEMEFHWRKDHPLTFPNDFGENGFRLPKYVVSFITHDRPFKVNFGKCASSDSFAFLNNCVASLCHTQNFNQNNFSLSSLFRHASND